MAIVLPTRTDLAHYSFEVVLDDVDYTIALDWNDRDGGWYLSIGLARGAALVQGRRVVVGAPLLSNYPDERLPPGVLVAIDSSGRDVEPSFSDLGARVLLVYLLESEV